MSSSSAYSAYADVQEVLDRALEAEKGIVLTLPAAEEGAARQWRQRAYRFRAMDRARNSKVYPEDSPMHFRSAYDELRIDIGEAPGTVEVRRISVVGLNLKIEELK